ncbi:MAG: thiamine-phosphate kinase [Alphaproteobacteria bacterium]|nr:thiamine-phosphate kinase [Alphaproteobacteria bacterium]
MTGPTRRGEFRLVADVFAPLASSYPLAFGLTDDAAVIASAPDEELVVTADALIAGVHFPTTERADLIARKALRVNLSDVAAMGGRPLSYVLTMALPEAVDEAWIELFAKGLKRDQDEFGVILIGGDTVATPGPLALSITMFGATPMGRRLRRNGARPGDTIVVSGTIGDGALGLKVALGEYEGRSDLAFLAERYRLPSPRVALGRKLIEVATAGLDVSDGLIADLGHICETSHVGARVEAARVPLSAPAASLLAENPDLLGTILGGGDDYELLFTVPPLTMLPPLVAAGGVALTPIGTIVDQRSVDVVDVHGRPLELGRAGYTHR